MTAPIDALVRAAGVMHSRWVAPDDPDQELPAAALWARAVDGDHPAFEAVYRQHVHAVYTHCVRRVGQLVDAQDLTAEVFVVAWRRRADLYVDPEFGVLPALLTTANNLVGAHHRQLARRERLVQAVTCEEPVPDVAATVTDEAADRDTLSVALKVLAGLGSKDRELIELCVMQGLSPQSVAESMNVPAGTVRSRLSRALVKARRRYARETASRSGAPVEERSL